MAASPVQHVTHLRFGGDQLVVREGNIAAIQFGPVGRLKPLLKELTKINPRTYSGTSFLLTALRLLEVHGSPTS